MKFGKNIARVVELSDPEWAPFWINYKFLKKKVKSIEMSPRDNKDGGDAQARTNRETIARSDGEVAFYKLLMQELEKSSDFFNDVEKQFLIRKKRVLEGWRQLTDTGMIMDGITHKRLMEACVFLYKDLLLLENYAIMNYCGFSKILKKHDKVTGLEGDISDEEDARLVANTSGEDWAGAKDRAQANFIQPEQSYEAAFQKIKEATGMDNVTDIVNKFLEAEEKNFSLFNFVNDLNSEIERLELMIADTKSDIDKYKGQGVSTDTQRKKVLRSLEEKLSVTEGKVNDYEARYQTAMKTINQLKTGIHSIFSRIGAGSNSSVEEMLGNQGVTESNMMQYLGIIEQRTSDILQAYATSQQMTQAADMQATKRTLDMPEISGAGTGAGVGSGALPTRLSVQPPAWDDFSSGEDSDAEDDERPLTRDELKKKTLRGGGKPKDSKAKAKQYFPRP